MNFPSHAYVAARLPGADPDLVLGAMLPDLVPPGAAAALDLPASVERGRRLHHRCDEAFHASPPFLAGCRSLRAELEASGVPRGARRGAAHAGYELLLDSALPWDDTAVGLYREAIGAGARLAGGAGWLARLRRLRSDPREWPADPALLARRVEALLARRPRLALPPGSVPAVEAALASARPRVHETAADVVAAVVGAAAADDPAEAPASLP